MNTEWKELHGIVAVAAAVTEGLEIESKLQGGSWILWPETAWYRGAQYRARSRKPAKVLVKRICWTSTGGNLTWTSEDYQFYAKDWKRFPAGDFEGEVEA